MATRSAPPRSWGSTFQRCDLASENDSKLKELHARRTDLAQRVGLAMLARRRASVQGIEAPPDAARTRTRRPEPRTVGRHGVAPRAPCRSCADRGLSSNAFSKKVANLEHSVAITFMHYNFCRVHLTIRVTPAMAAGLTDRVWELADRIALMPKPVARPWGSVRRAEAANA